MGKNWKVIEMLGYSYFCEKGFRILVPLIQDRGYDFAIEYYGTFQRINVKLAGLKDKNIPNSWSISMPGGRPYKSSKMKKKLIEYKANTPRSDIYLVWLPQQERFIELSGDFFKGSKSKSKLIPKDLLELGGDLQSPLSSPKEGQRWDKHLI